MMKDAHDEAGVYRDATIGLYAAKGDSGHRLILTAISPETTATLVVGLAPAGAIDAEMPTFGVEDATPYPPGPFGGALECGTEPPQEGPMTTCAWADSTTMAIVSTSGVSAPALARITLALRGAAEA